VGVCGHNANESVYIFDESGSRTICTDTQQVDLSRIDAMKFILGIGTFSQALMFFVFRL